MGRAMSTDNLKFRVWDNDEKRYRDIDDSFLLSMEGDLVIWHDYDRFIRIAGKIRFIVERCTGLRDSNGVTIYEGDVLERGKYKTTEPFVVHWNQNAGRWSIHSKTLEPWCLKYDLTETEIYVYGYKVVGNVHQNAECSKR